MVSVFIAHLSNYADFTWRSGFLAFFQYYLRVGLLGVMLPPCSSGLEERGSWAWCPFRSTLNPPALLFVVSVWLLDTRS